MSVEAAAVQRVAMPDEVPAVGSLKSNESLAMTNAQRSEDLFRRGFVIQRVRDEAAAALAVARAGAELAARLDKTVIRAPFSGIVGIRDVSVGDYVKEGADLVNLEVISTLKVDFRLPDICLSRISRGQLLEVSSDALPDAPFFSARVDAVDPLVNAEGRALLLRARLDNRDGLLRPGMFVRVRLLLSEREALVVPEEALTPSGEGQFVCLVRDDKALRVPVRLGVRRAGSVEVSAGLEAGAMVVTAGHVKLCDGAPVSRAETPLARAAAD